MKYFLNNIDTFSLLCLIFLDGMFGQTLYLKTVHLRMLVFL